MHKTAMHHGRLFFETYAKPGSRIVDIGAQDVNGSLRSVAPAGADYVGVDFVSGRGVDVVITDPYSLPFENETVDVLVSSSCFEHSEFFWLTFLDNLRILKPTGIMYINVPSNGPIHRYPVDCWRFYPDSGIALESWAKRNGIDTLMLESFTGPQITGLWNDFVAVFVKDEAKASLYTSRIQDRYPDFTNGRVAGSDQIRNLRELSEDQSTFGHRVRWKVRRVLGRGPE